MDDKKQINYISGNKSVKSALAGDRKLSESANAVLKEAQSALKVADLNDDFALECVILYRIGKLRAQIPEIRAEKEKCASLRWNSVREAFERKFDEIENSVELYAELLVGEELVGSADRGEKLKKLFFEFEDCRAILKGCLELMTCVVKTDKDVEMLQDSIMHAHSLEAQYVGELKIKNSPYKDAEKVLDDAQTYIKTYDSEVEKYFAEGTLFAKVVGRREEVISKMNADFHNKIMVMDSKDKQVNTQLGRLTDYIKVCRAELEKNVAQKAAMTDRYLKRVTLKDGKYSEKFGTVFVDGFKVRFTPTSILPEPCAVVTLQTLDGVYAAKGGGLKISLQYLKDSGIIAEEAQAVLLVDAGGPIKIPSNCLVDTKNIYFSLVACHSFYEKR